MKGKKLISSVWAIAAALLFLTGCSTTKNLPEGEVLYTGIHQIAYVDKGDKVKTSRKDSTGVILAVADAASKVDHILKGNFAALGGDGPSVSEKDLTKEERAALRAEQKAEIVAFEDTRTELDAVLEYAPNNSLFGSAYHRTPFPTGLWAYNQYVNSTSAFGKWMFKTFSGEPVLISTVNPDTRVKVATNTLHNYGYFRGNVRYELVPHRKDAKKAKINYYVKAGKPFLLDSIQYRGFPSVADSLIRATLRQSKLRKGDAFSVLNLTEEQTRLETLFRNRGYYYYQANSATFKADTLQVPLKVQLVMEPKQALMSRSGHPWFMRNTHISVYGRDGDTLRSERRLRRMTIRHSGEKNPLYPLVWIQNIAHRPGTLYRQDDQDKTQEMLSSLGIFSQLNVNYLPADTAQTCDSLDLWISAVLDKPYTTDLEMNVTSKNNDRIGPGMTLTLARKNAFRGAETVNLKLFGSYEWRTHAEKDARNNLLNSYELGTQLSLDFPRVVFPGISRRQFRFPTATSFAINADWLNRSGYFNLFSMGLQATYSWHKKNTSRHELVPFSLTYAKLLNSTMEFDSIMQANPVLYVSMRDRFVPAMQYTYTYTSSARHRNPLWWQLIVKEAGNVTSGIYALAGKKFNEKNKELFRNPFAQYVKVSSELHNTFRLHREYKLVTRLMGGVIYSYGNSNVAPYSDQFFVGGANSLRAFTIRTVGPGRYSTPRTRYSYLDQTGELKLEANVEFRFPMFGSLKGALFVDAGNVWLLREDASRPGGKFEAAHFLKDIALGTGAGLRYDMDFLIIRFDLGVALHDPGKNYRSGYYNIGKFKDGLALHFAIGYPF